MLFPVMILGLLATISLEFAPLFLMLFPLSTVLQANSIISYNNLLTYNINNKLKKHNENNSIINNEKEKSLDRTISKDSKIKIKSHNESMNLLDELAFYIMTPYWNLEQNNNKTKRRKK